jgi:uncharacterized protein with NAD-binding domain and iron-sulfur cluster
MWKLKSVPVMNVQIWYDRKVCDTDNLFFTFLAGCYTYQDYMASREGAVQSGYNAAQAIFKN